MKTPVKHRHIGALPRLLVGQNRSGGSDLALATVLAAIAGAANAGGFFALGQYTSHMTGHLSQLADNLALLNWLVVLTSLLAIAAFVTGAAFSTVLINWARSHHGRHQYAMPLAIQGLLMICFSWGGIFSTAPGRLFALACLCFIMGMQNATITKISSARIRTTHATGMITDIGIEIGRGIFGLASGDASLRWDGVKLAILLRLVLAFLLGGLTGALGYGQFGFFFSLPLAFVLLALSLPTILSSRMR